MNGAFSRRPWGGSWFDPALALAFFLACEAEAVSRDLGGGRSSAAAVAEVAVLGVLTLPLAWRRRAPLLSACLVMGSAVVLVAGIPGSSTLNAPQLVLFVAPYSVAAAAPRERAWLGLAACLAAVAALNLSGPFQASSWVFSVGACCASWATGRSLRARRALAAELRQAAERIAAERGGRELLAIAEQRTRIARELQTLVARSVSTMIVQTQAAQRMLDEGSDEADAAMAVIEETGRQALTEMRRVLGVLRHPEEQVDLAPQPGVGQIPLLVEQARHAHRRLALQVEGEPGPLPASVDLAVYRIVEDLLTGGEDTTSGVDIVLRFGEDDVELTVTGEAAHLDWPTLAVRERVALCQGTVDVGSLPGSGERLVARLPRLFEGVPA